MSGEWWQKWTTNSQEEVNTEGKRELIVAFTIACCKLLPRWGFYIYRYLQIFADICTYLQIFADICRYLQIFVDICQYLHFADICISKLPLDGFWYLQTGSFLPISTILTCRLDMGRGWILMDWPRSSDCPRFLLIFSQMIFSDCPRFLSFIFTNDLGRLFHLVF